MQQVLIQPISIFTALVSQDSYEQLLTLPQELAKLVAPYKVKPIGLVVNIFRNFIDTYNAGV